MLTGATRTAETGVTLSWQQHVTPCDGFAPTNYRIYMANADSGPWEYLRDVEGLASTSVGLVSIPSQTEYFQIEACDDSGNCTPRSNVVSAGACETGPKYVLRAYGADDALYCYVNGTLVASRFFGPSSIDVAIDSYLSPSGNMLHCVATEINQGNCYNYRYDLYRYGIMLLTRSALYCPGGYGNTPVVHDETNDIPGSISSCEN